MCAAEEVVGIVAGAMGFEKCIAVRDVTSSSRDENVQQQIAGRGIVEER
jgi:hypothetical protein